PRGQTLVAISATQTRPRPRGRSAHHRRQPRPARRTRHALLAKQVTSSHRPDRARRGSRTSYTVIWTVPRAVLGREMGRIASSSRLLRQCTRRRGAVTLGTSVATRRGKEMGAGPAATKFLQPSLPKVLLDRAWLVERLDQAVSASPITVVTGY